MVLRCVGRDHRLLLRRQGVPVEQRDHGQLRPHPAAAGPHLRLGRCVPDRFRNHHGGLVPPHILGHTAGRSEQHGDQPGLRWVGRLRHVPVGIMHCGRRGAWCRAGCALVGSTRRTALDDYKDEALQDGIREKSRPQWKGFNKRSAPCRSGRSAPVGQGSTGLAGSSSGCGAELEQRR